MRSTPLTLAVLVAAAACSSSSTNPNQDKDGGNTEPDTGSKTDGGNTKGDGGNTKNDGGNTNGDGGSGSDTGSNSDGGNTNSDSGSNKDGGGGSGSWTAMTFSGDHDIDTVTGIYYSTPTSGLIVTVPGEDANAGAVFAATATKLGSIVFDGDVATSAGGVLGGLEFWGF